MNKSQIRKKILKIRKRKDLKNHFLNFQEITKVLSKRTNIKIIGGYYPYNHEIDDIEILKKLEKKNYKISLPRIKKNKQMDFFEWSFDHPLSVNKHGIAEPFSNKIKYPDVLFVPLVAFDKKLNRIGYGGGYYDRYIQRIQKIKKVTTIGLAYSFQRVNSIPINKNDIKLDFIITDKRN